VDDNPTRVLVVEDDPNIVDLLRANLLVRGFHVDVSTTGTDALALFERTAPDVALLDLMLPGASGFDLCQQIRSASDIGIIVLSARGGETDKVRALNLGADDYLTKPFGIDELLARIQATLRRSRPAPEAADPHPVIRSGEVEIDIDAQLVTLGGEVVRLTPTEFALLRELALHAGTVVSHATLLGRVWGPGYATETEYTRVYVRRLRAKLEPPGSAPVIVPEHRIGYRFVAD
jgi:two-component system, OmpR family, KDP operon response regulator KdpE